MQNVYFSKIIDIESVLDKIFFEDVTGERVGIKVHFGEKNCSTFVPAKYVRRVCDYVRKRGGEPVLIETNVLYRGERMKANSHIALARSHGFDFAEIDILDGKMGENSVDYPMGLKHYTRASVGGNLKNYKKLIVVSHFKGHIQTGFGGAIKNVGMGLASRGGKLKIHASRPPRISFIKCDKCETCVNQCQGDAITLGTFPRIDAGKCESCGMCIAQCPKKAVSPRWLSSSFRTVQERIVEYAYAVTRQHEMIYLNFAINLTRNCDCVNHEQSVIAKDVGLFGGGDLLATETATYDRVNNKRRLYRQGAQLKYGKKVRLGEDSYRIIDVE
jgi:uncharacterized Fe-S center protein